MTARDDGTFPGPAAPPAPAAPGPGGDPREEAAASLRFARLLGALGLLIVAATGLLLVLPAWLDAPTPAWLLAYAIAILFGPIGFTLLAAAWRMRNVARHGTAWPASQRRGAIAFGALLFALGAVLVGTGFGVSGTISFWLNLVWGIALALYGLRLALRALLAPGP